LRREKGKLSVVDSPRLQLQAVKKQENALYANKQNPIVKASEVKPREIPDDCHEQIKQLRLRLGSSAN
jgi:hypothetical protein